MLQLSLLPHLLTRTLHILLWADRYLRFTSKTRASRHPEHEGKWWYREFTGQDWAMKMQIAVGVAVAIYFVILPFSLTKVQVFGTHVHLSF